MRTALIALAIATTAPAGIAAAQTPPDAAPPPRAPVNMLGALMRADADRDGIVTRDEVVASSDRTFDRLDANHDGAVGGDEIAAMRGMTRPGGPGGPGGPGAPPPPPTGAGAPPVPPPPGAAVTRSFTRAQWHDRALAQFDRLDGNHDGRVDQAEMDAYRERRRQRRPGEAPPPLAPPAPAAGR